MGNEDLNFKSLASIWAYMGFGDGNRAGNVFSAVYAIIHRVKDGCLVSEDDSPATKQNTWLRQDAWWFIMLSAIGVIVAILSFVYQVGWRPTFSPTVASKRPTITPSSLPSTPADRPTSPPSSNSGGHPPTPTLPFSPTPTPQTYTYNWMLNSDCSDQQGANWQPSTSSPTNAICSGDAMALTAKQANNLCSNDGTTIILCNSYSMVSLPAQRPFVHNFDVSVRIRPGSAPYPDDSCGELLLRYNAATDNIYHFEICTSGYGQIYFSLACSSCKNSSSQVTSVSFPSSNYLVTVQVRGSAFKLLIDTGKGIATFNSTNTQFPGTIEGIGVEVLGTGDHNDQSVTTEFSNLTYQEVP